MGSRVVTRIALALACAGSPAWALPSAADPAQPVAETPRWSGGAGPPAALAFEPEPQIARARVAAAGFRPGPAAEPLPPATPTVSQSDTESLGLDLRLRGVARRDQLDWNIHDQLGSAANVLSELQWRNIQSRGLGLSGDFTFPSGFIAVGRASYGWIGHGDNQDSDFDGHDRTDEFSRSNNDASTGAVLETSAGLGYRLALGGAQVHLTPLLGLAYQRQALRMRKGVQTIPDEGPFPGLHSRYTAEWFSPWAGLKLDLEPTERWQVELGLELHRAYYRAEANWNLRDDLAHPTSFEHRARGWGGVLQAELNWRMTRHWTVSLSGRALGFRTRPGSDKAFFAGGSSEKSRLNEVNWYSRELGLAVGYRF